MWRSGLQLLLALSGVCVLAGEVPAPRPTTAPALGGVRVKDAAEILGVRDNQLVGQGLIVGLEGSGDKTGTLAPQALSNVLSRMGISISAAALKPKNVAVVAVTAQLSAFMRKGAKLDVQVSSVGDASSLQGGILLQTPLQGADGRVYAVAQGAISIGGFNVGTGGEGGASIQKNHTLAGRIPNGALVEREVETTFQQCGVVRLALREGDFTTAQRLATTINERWPGTAKALDPHTVEFQIPKNDGTDPAGAMAVIAELESLRFQPDVRARVAINERTGTIVAGADVRLLPTVLSHGNLYIVIKQTTVFGPASLIGQAPAGTETQTAVKEEPAHVIPFQPGPTLGDLAAALNALKVSPRDIIAVFQALKAVGALNADLVIM